DVIQASLVKDTMKRKRPAFSEAALGYGSFSQLLEDAQKAGIVTLREDERSGTYVVTGVVSGGGGAADKAAGAGNGTPRPRRRRDRLPRGAGRQPLPHEREVRLGRRSRRPADAHERDPSDSAGRDLG